MKELQEFAFKGCADLDEIKRQRKARDNAEGQSEEVLKNQKRQMQLIDQLREQLTDLEKFAYETGQGGLPSNELIAKQVIFKALLTCEEQLIDGVFAAVSRFKPKSLCVGVVVSWKCIIKSCGQ